MPILLKLEKFTCVKNVFFLSQWRVQTVFIHEISPNCVMKAKVRASQCVTSDPHQAWVGVVRETGKVITGHCTCMAGLVLMIYKLKCCVLYQRIFILHTYYNQ